MIELRQKINKHYQTLNLLIDNFLSFGMMLYAIGLIMQDSNCGYKFGLCIAQLDPGNWDIFNHSLFYDIFFLRGNSNVEKLGQVGSHWSSSLMIAVIFFFTAFYTWNRKFAFVQAAFVTFYHESLWHFTVVLHNGQLDIGYLLYVALIAGNIAVFFLFRRAYFTKEFLLLSIPFVLFLAYWWIADGMAVTVFGNYPTGTFMDALNNELEVLSWFLVTVILALNTIIIKRKHVVIWLK